MCNELLQVYACGCKKQICTTACPHALTTGTPGPLSPHNLILDPPFQYGTRSQPITTTNLRHASFSGPNAPHVTTSRASPPVTPDHPPQILHPPYQERLAIDDLPSQTPRLTVHTPSHSVTSLRTSSLPSTPLRGQHQPQTQLHPEVGNATPLPNSYSPTANPKDAEIQPNYCIYVFKRHLAPSRYPCLECYMRPEWDAYRAKWMNDYRVLHPGTKSEDLERMSGVSLIGERVGLVNVVREMERLDGLGEGES